MPPNAVESGIKSLRAHFVRETVTGEIQADPAWLRFSDTIRRIGPSPDANVYMQRGVGNHDLTGFLIGPEDHDFDVEYELQKWLTSGNDAAADGLLRASDGGILNTHGILLRQDLVSGGSLDNGRRIYTVAKGGRIANVGLSGDPNTGEPLVVTLSYMFEKVRSYIIDQPDGASTVDVVSSDASDTTQTVTVEDEGAGTSETISLNGTTQANGATSFSDIDSISLDAETEGDVTVSIGGTTIMVIKGKTSNGGFDGDLGVPPLGSGSFEADLGTDYEIIVGSSIQRGGADLEENATVSTFGVTVENNLDRHPRVDSRKRRIIEGSRDITVNANIFSEKGSHDSFVEHVTVTESDIVWTLNQGSITISNAALTTLGARIYEAGQAVMRRDNVFTGRGITIA